MPTTLTTGLIVPTTTTRITPTLQFPSSRLPTKEHVSIEEVFNAYYSCRKKKRRKKSALQFELDYELECYKLWDELNSVEYKPTTSIAFCITRPKLREVFAANFRDRIVHHLLCARLNTYFEQEMSEDAFACRVGKGTLYGVKKIQQYMKECGNEAWYTKCDISGFFMAINRDILYNEIKRILIKNNIDDIQWWLWLAKIVIYNRPELDCEMRGDLSLFVKLPKNKSLFSSNGVGLPIGNLTSQILANVYMSIFDRWIANKIGSNGRYGRYVDDFIIIHKNKKFLLSALNNIRQYLQNALHLKIHPKKITIQQVHKGVKFTGTFIKGNCRHPGGFTKYNAMQVIKKRNLGLNIDEQHFISSANSYFGLLIHSNSYNFRIKMWKRIVDRTNVCFINNKKLKLRKT